MADKDKETPVEKIGVGVFAKELERALLNREIDCAVHSLKDMPVKIESGTVISCFTLRQDPGDCLVLREGISADSLESLRIGTGSPRRTAFLKELEPGVQALPLRGNVNTRLRKMDQGDYDGIVLASCGLIRLGLQNRIRRHLDPGTFVPAAGQGIICSQTRVEDRDFNRALEGCSDPESQEAALAERKVLEELEVGCAMPFGVFARFEGDRFKIAAKAYLESSLTYIYESSSSSRPDSAKATNDLISKMKTGMGKS
jgi:hydroxymethylbilane synthase